MTKYPTAEIEKQIQECSEKINYYVVEFTLDYLAKELDEEGDNDKRFYVPDYQRDFVWDNNRQCRFIESVILGLPIPFLFFCENNENGKIEIIDGCQRLRTIKRFVSGELKLNDLERLDKLNGLCFHDLTKERQRKITNKSIRGIMLDERIEESVRMDLFHRINTSSKHANSAEIRRGSLKGAFSTLLEELSNEKQFRKMVRVSERREREQEYLELVTRFFAYGDGLEGYKDRVDEFLYNYVKKMNQDFTKAQEKEYRERFKKTLRFVKKYFPQGFENPVSKRKYTRTRFESIAVGCWRALRDKKEEDLHTTDMQWLDSDEYKKVLRSDAANNIKNLQRRLDYVYLHLIGK